MKFLKVVSIGTEKNYAFNDYINICNQDCKEFETVITFEDSVDIFESHGVLFHKALQLAFPKINIRVTFYKDIDETLYCVLKDWNTSLINYYGVNGDNFSFAEPTQIINEIDIIHLKNVYDKIIQHNKRSTKLREDSKWSPTRWNFAYNQYISACIAGSIETSIFHIISGLEAMLLKTPGELTYKVALFAGLVGADNDSERKRIRDLVKGMYDIRSKVVHGDINNSIINKLQSPNFYSDYFCLKEVLANILNKFFDFDENKIHERIEQIIFESPSF